MTDSISSISNASSANKTAASSNSASKLTDATKKKLEAMGVSTSNIKTEADGQTKLQQVQAQQQQQAQAAQGNKGGGSEAAIKTEVTDLASKMGVTVGNDDKVSTILDNVSTKLSELQAAAGNDPAKASEYQDYQSQYDSINQEYSQAQTSKSMLTGSLSGMANYNKVLLGLS